MGTVHLRADDVGRAGKAGSYLRMGNGARLFGMGGGGVALGDDAFSTTHNPAGLVYLEQKSLVASLSSMALDRKLQYIGYAQALGKKPGSDNGAPRQGPPRAGFALGWLSAGVDKIDGRDFNGAHTEMYSMSEHAFYFAFAIQPAPFLSVGFAGKGLYSRMPNMTNEGNALSTTGFGFDLGLMLKPTDDLSLGIAVQDLRSKYTWDSQHIYDRGTQSLDTMAQVLTVGAGYSPRSNVLINCNVVKVEDWPAVFRGGVEVECLPGFFVRGGYYERAVCAGAGYLLTWQGRSVQIDYAYIPDPVAPRGDHVFSWSFLF